MSDLSDMETNLVQQALRASAAARKLGEPVVQAIVLYNTRDLGKSPVYDPAWFEGWTYYDSLDEACEDNGIDKDAIRKSCKEFYMACHDGEMPTRVTLNRWVDSDVEGKLFDSFCVLYVGDLWDRSVAVRPRGVDEEKGDYVMYEGELSVRVDGKWSLHGDLPRLLMLGVNDQIMVVANDMDEKFGNINCVTSAQYGFRNTFNLITIFVKRAGSQWEYLCEPLAAKDFDPHYPEEDFQHILDLVYEGETVRYQTLVDRSADMDDNVLYRRWEKL